MRLFYLIVICLLLVCSTSEAVTKTTKANKSTGFTAFTDTLATTVRNTWYIQIPEGTQLERFGLYVLVKDITGSGAGLDFKYRNLPSSTATLTIPDGQAEVGTIPITLSSVAGSSAIPIQFRGASGSSSTTISQSNTYQNTWRLYWAEDWAPLISGTLELDWGNNAANTVLVSAVFYYIRK